MQISTVRPATLAAAFALAGCGGGGGGGGGGVVSMPPPPVISQPEIPAIIPAATTSQQFTVMGATFLDGLGSTLDPGTQIKLRYDATSQSYEIYLPDGLDWQAISYDVSGASFDDYRSDSVLMNLPKGDYQYSRLLNWNDGANSGHNAVGIATPAGGVPVTGSANYAGQIQGLTSDHNGLDFGIDGTIALSFDFALGNLSGSLSAKTNEGYALDPLNFRDTVYSTGNTTFSGKFDTNLPGVNGFSGHFTGPSAQELIGGFAFPYSSPIDGLTYQADGAFVGAK